MYKGVEGRGHISEKSFRLFTHIHESPKGDSFIGDQGRGPWASPGPLGPWFPYKGRDHKGTVGSLIYCFQFFPQVKQVTNMVDGSSALRVCNS